jgi:hypothetical protein
MKLLLYSHFFAPSIGGVETIVQLLASGLAELASNGGKQFEVVLVTQTPADNFDSARDKNIFQIRADVMRGCDDEYTSHAATVLLATEGLPS